MTRTAFTGMFRCAETICIPTLDAISLPATTGPSDEFVTAHERTRGM